MPTTVIVDSGPLIAAYNTSDRYHQQCVELFRRRDLDFVVPALCIGEAAYVVGARVDSGAEANFVRAVSSLDLRLPEQEDWLRIADEISRYSDFDIGAVDASVIVLAERLGSETIATIDHRHFRAVRPRHVEAFTLLPELPN